MNLDKIRKLVEFDTCTVANGLAGLNFRDPTAGYTGPDVRALMPDFGPRVGIAVTARMDTTSPGDEKSKSLFKDWVRLIRAAAKGDSTGPMPVFAVMESVGTRPRYTVTIGDGMGTLMKLAGAAGFLTNGCIRDLDGVRDVPLACWGAGISPMHGELRWLDVNSPVVIDGVTIRPGDFIHADVNGAIVIPPSVIDQAYDRAQGVRQMEQDLFKKWRSSEFNIDAYLSGSEL